MDYFFFTHLRSRSAPRTGLHPFWMQASSFAAAVELSALQLTVHEAIAPRHSTSVRQTRSHFKTLG
nr:hypothetical protein [Dendronalium sp. ChiSLP03b]